MEERVVAGKNPPSQGDGFLLAVKKTSLGSHIGIGHLDPSNGWFLLHHGGHNGLSNTRLEDWSSGYLWVFPAISEYEAESLRASARLFWKRNVNAQTGTVALPYGFSLPMGWLNEVDASIAMPPGASGLTCASFVLAIFEYSKIHLIDFEGWPQRKEDVDTQTLFADLVGRKFPEQADRMRLEIGNPRARPEEVAGASICQKRPVKFEAVQPFSEYIVSRITSN